MTLHKSFTSWINILPLTRSGIALCIVTPDCHSGGVWMDGRFDSPQATEDNGTLVTVEICDVESNTVTERLLYFYAVLWCASFSQYSFISSPLSQNIKLNSFFFGK